MEKIQNKDKIKTSYTEKKKSNGKSDTEVAKANNTTQNARNENPNQDTVIDTEYGNKNLFNK